VLCDLHLDHIDHLDAMIARLDARIELATARSSSRRCSR
jgi:hypothetical protein